MRAQKKAAPRDRPLVMGRIFAISVDKALFVQNQQNHEDRYHSNADVDIGIHDFLLEAMGRESPDSHAPMNIPKPPMNRP